MTSINGLIINCLLEVALKILHISDTSIGSFISISIENYRLV